MISQHHWKKSHLLLGLSIILFLHKFQPALASPITGLLSPDKDHSESKSPERRTISSTANERHSLTNQANSNDKNENTDHSVHTPKTAKTETRQTAKDIQNLAKGSLSIKSQILPVNIKSITKRSTQLSSFPNEIHKSFDYDNMDELKEQFKVCGDESSRCSSQHFNDELQQIADFKTPDHAPWDNPEYISSKYYENADYFPNIFHTNLGLFYTTRKSTPYNHEAQNANSNAYHLKQNVDKYRDTYLDDDRQNIHNQVDFNSQLPRAGVLGLQKQLPLELTGQSLPIESDMQNEDLELQPTQKVKKNIFTSRGWGAGGMPFSVLYMHKQQHLKPAARLPIPEAQQLVAPQPLRGFPTPSQYRQVAVRNALSSALTSGSNGGGGSGTPLPTRRQYSIIPQLYVSYGWGPHGK